MLRHRLPAFVTCSQAGARRKLDKKTDRRAKASKNVTDEFYASFLALRAEPTPTFLGHTASKWALPITSANEHRFLKLLGIPADQRNQIEGLVVGSAAARDEERQIANAVVRLAADPPPSVGQIQRCSAKHLIRPYPIGIRFSGKNMSPLPPWLGGAQHVCLNFSDVDLAAQMHFALFRGSSGFVLKPSGMRFVQNGPESLKRIPKRSSSGSDWQSERSRCTTAGISTVSVSSSTSRITASDDRRSQAEEGHYWPPVRDTLHCISIEILSLHMSPKRGERRPRFDGSHSACHCHHPELSGTAAPPKSDKKPSSPSITLALHPIGGFCAVSDTLPMPWVVQTDTKLTSSKSDNGLNVTFGQEIHCVVAEPHSVFLRVGVVDGGQEAAFELAVLGRLRGGFRVFQLRGMLGTRIELNFLFVCIRFGSKVVNLWPTPRQLELRRLESAMLGLEELEQEIMKLKEENQKLQESQDSDQRV